MLYLTVAALALAGPARPTQAGPPPDQELIWSQALWLHSVFGQAGDQFPQPESVRMLAAILSGSRMGPGGGWFGPSRSRYGWSWLRKHYPPGRGGAITRAEFRGPKEWFDRLDRDRNGVLTAADFDWSPKAPFLRETSPYEGWFRQMDGDSNGRVSRKEWQAFFDRVAKGKDHLTAEDLRLALQPPAPSPSKTGGGPPRALLLRNLLRGDLGSPCEGPRPGAVAPDFTLPTHDGKANVALSDFRGRKPVVLIFGSFT